MTFHSETLRNANPEETKQMKTNRFSKTTLAGAAMLAAASAVPSSANAQAYYQTRPSTPYGQPQTFQPVPDTSSNHDRNGYQDGPVLHSDGSYPDCYTTGSTVRCR